MTKLILLDSLPQKVRVLSDCYTEYNVEFLQDGKLCLIQKFENKSAGEHNTKEINLLS